MFRAAKIKVLTVILRALTGGKRYRLELTPYRCNFREVSDWMYFDEAHEMFNGKVSCPKKLYDDYRVVTRKGRVVTKLSW